MSASLILSVAKQQLDADPLSRFRFACDGQRSAARYFFQGFDTHARCANQAGKTTLGSACVTALAQGRDVLDDLPVPKVPQPSTWWVITKTRRQQVEAAQKAYTERLGEWPHEIAWASKALGYAEVLRVRYQGCKSDDPAKWSRIVFHCEADGESLPGGRVNGVHADEAPKERNWTEARARGISNQTLFRIITETPLNREDWEWLKESEAGYRGCLMRPREGRVEVTWSLRDVRVHSQEYVDALIASYAGDPYFEARVNGDYVDALRTCPFDSKALNRWLSRCREPIRVDTIPLIGSEDGEGATAAQVQVWEDARADEVYLAVLDPSSGVPDSSHDPMGLLVMAQRRPRLVARVATHLDPWSSGLLLDAVGRKYRRCKVWPETNRFGDTVIAALRSRRYPNIGRQESASNAGQVREQYGFATTEINRWQAVAAIQKALAEDSIDVPSIEVVRQLADTRVVRLPSGAEKWESKGKDHHGEDVTCLGWALRQMALPSAHVGAYRPPPEGAGYIPFNEVVRRELGIPRRKAPPPAPRLRFGP